jgi:hypothetical protein
MTAPISCAKRAVGTMLAIEADRRDLAVLTAAQARRSPGTSIATG